MDTGSYTQANRRLAKNTVALFFRQTIVLVVQLFVTRLILKALGADDFGIYSVVGSVVLLFSFFNTAMSTASQRFITYELGTGDRISTSKVFSASLVVQISVAVFLLLLIEGVGYWMLNYKLNIPPERLTAANIAFQFSMLTFCISVIRVPFEATVIAHEKLTFFAYTGILEVLLRLGQAYILLYTVLDRLILYAALLAVIALTLFLIYIVYCRRRLKTCDFTFVKDKNLYKKLFSYTGWSLLGSGTNVLTQQGFVFLINIFFGVVVNAAMGIANQVNAAIAGFTGSFLTSYRPQIVKYYSKNDIDHVNWLISMTSKMSFALMIIPVVILIFNMPFVLSLWLVEVPNYAVEFCRIILICTIIDAVTGSYNAAIMASNQIRNYQVAISCSFVLDLILSYFLIKIGVLPYLVLISRIMTRGIINMIIGLLFIKNLLSFDVRCYLKSVLLPMLLIVCLFFPVLYFLNKYPDGGLRFFVSSLVIVAVCSTSIYFVLFSGEERKYAFNMIKGKLK